MTVIYGRRRIGKSRCFGDEQIANKKAVLGECKFKNEVIDKEVYEALMDRRGLIDKRYEEVEFLLFSLTGFSKRVV